MRKPSFAYAKTKAQISFAVTAKLISAFAFATYIVQSIFFLNPKFKASSHLLWLYSPVCVGPGRKTERWFSHDAAHLCCSCLCRQSWLCHNICIFRYRCHPAEAVGSLVWEMEYVKHTTLRLMIEWILRQWTIIAFVVQAIMIRIFPLTDTIDDWVAFDVEPTIITCCIAFHIEINHPVVVTEPTINKIKG